MNAPEIPAPAPLPGGPLGRLAWRVPLGWQLSGLYTLLLVGILSVVGVVVYTQQQSFLVDDAARRLEQTATRVVDRQDRFPGDGRGGPPGELGRNDPGGRGRDTSGPGGPNLLESVIHGLSGPDVTVTLLDPSGRVLTSTQELVNEDARLIDPVTPAQAAQVVTTARPIRWIAARADGTRQVVVLMAVPWFTASETPGAAAVPTTYLLEQSASLAAVDAALARLGLYLLLGVLGGTVAGVGLGLLLTRSVLRPLDRVTHTAEAIAAGDLQRRLELPPGGNEVARLGQTFDNMVGRLVATLEAQRRFVADASHELRTPLTSLRGLAEILMIGAHGDDSRVIEQSAQSIHDELGRLSRLVNDLLTLSRLDSTRDGSAPPFRRLLVDACAPLTAATEQMSALAEARRVALIPDCREPLWVMGDAGQLKQVLLNLLDNALRYTPAGGSVTLRGRVEGGSVRIEVQDTGLGITAADLPHVFERFYRADASRTRATGNSGLGLAIVQSIIAAHGGQITVHSAAGAGTCFTIRLPRAAPPAPADAGPPAAPGPLALSEPRSPMPVGTARSGGSPQ